MKNHTLNPEAPRGVEMQSNREANVPRDQETIDHPLPADIF
jgi:hypothetical protein